MYWNGLESCMVILLGRLHCIGGCGADVLSHPLRGGKGLCTGRLLPLEGIGESLLSQVFVPLLGELLVLFIERGVEDVLAVTNDGVTTALLRRSRSASRRV
jgi:hypothetical protein